MNEPVFSEDKNRGDGSLSQPKLSKKNLDQNPSPNAETSNDSESGVRYRLLPLEESPVVAEVVQTGSDAGPLDDPKTTATTFAMTDAAPSVQISNDFQNMAAIGGAVGAVVLGLWSIISSLVTYFGFVNALLALAMGIYGLTSKRRSLAIVGMIMGLIGLVLSLMEINGVLSAFFTAQDLN